MHTFWIKHTSHWPLIGLGLCSYYQIIFSGHLNILCEFFLNLIFNSSQYQTHSLFFKSTPTTRSLICLCCMYTKIYTYIHTYIHLVNPCIVLYTMSQYSPVNQTNCYCSSLPIHCVLAICTSWRWTFLFKGVWYINSQWQFSLLTSFAAFFFSLSTSCYVFSP